MKLSKCLNYKSSALDIDYRGEKSILFSLVALKVLATATFCIKIIKLLIVDLNQIYYPCKIFIKFMCSVGLSIISDIIYSIVTEFDNKYGNSLELTYKWNKYGNSLELTYKQNIIHLFLPQEWLSFDLIKNIEYE
jgi:hypothetical protein